MKKGERKTEGDERTGRRKKEKEKSGTHAEEKGQEGKEGRNREGRGRDFKTSPKKERGAKIKANPVPSTIRDRPNIKVKSNFMNI
jgi:hypothetical protein